LRRNNHIVNVFENAAILCFMTHLSKCCPDGHNNLEPKCTD